MKRVKQISFDIVVHPNIDGDRLSEEMAEALESLGYTVLGAGFQCDLTDEYKESHPDLL